MYHQDGGDGGDYEGSQPAGGDYPTNDASKDEVIMKLRSQNVKLRQKLKELN
jgi:hypothetical protein